MKKLILFGTILSIFILCTTSFFPIIIAHKHPIEETHELTDITIELCGIKDADSYDVELTKSQLNQLINLLESYKNKEQTDISMVSETINELSKMDIIDSKHSIQLKSCFSQRWNNYIENNIPITSDEELLQNYMCFTVANIEKYGKPLSVNPILAGITLLLLYIGEKLDLLSDELSPSMTIYEVFVLTFAAFSVILGSKNPISILQIVDFDFIGPYYGWLNTYGLLGVKKVNGLFIGQIFGFTGIKLFIKNYGYFMIGFSPYIRMIQLED